MLDSTILDEIAEIALAGIPTGKRAYVDPVLHVITTVSNLAGVPYNIPFEGENRGGQDLSLHADYVHFTVTNDVKIKDDEKIKEPGALDLDWQKTNPNWFALRAAALASGAFPVGLAPRPLSYDFATMKRDIYDERRWPIPTGGKTSKGELQCVEMKSIHPYWPGNKRPDDYRFLCVDGGLMNNEPLEIARQLLAGAGSYNPRGAQEARRAVVMIDPFPGVAQSDLSIPEAPKTLLGILIAIFGALKNQARFKPEELELAQDPNVFSRFLIGPTRTLGDGTRAKFPIASALLDGFGGFLSREFRKHDFVLGRRNCQQFLKCHFLLFKDNPLFSKWKTDADLERKYKVTQASHDFLPIIPLVGSAQENIEQLPWPSYSLADLDELLQHIQSRYEVVSDRLVSYYFRNNNRFVRWIAAKVAKQKTTDVLQFAREQVTTGLQRLELLQRLP